MCRGRRTNATYLTKSIATNIKSGQYILRIRDSRHGTWDWLLLSHEPLDYLCADVLYRDITEAGLEW